MVLSDTVTKPRYVKLQEAGGSSLLITIPKDWAYDLGLEKGDFVRIWMEGRKIIVEKAE